MADRLALSAWLFVCAAVAAVVLWSPAAGAQVAPAAEVPFDPAPSIAWDAERGVVVIAAVDSDTGDLLIRTVVPSGADETQRFDHVDLSGGPSLVLDASGGPVVAYEDAVDGAVKLLRCGADCGAAEPVTVGAAGERPVVRLDSAGVPVVAYRESSYGDLLATRCLAIDCGELADPVTMITGSGSNLEPPFDVVLDEQDRPIAVVSISGASLLSFYRNVTLASCDDVECSATTRIVAWSSLDNTNWYSAGQPALDAGWGANGDLVVAMQFEERLGAAVLRCDLADETCGLGGFEGVLGRGGVSLGIDAADRPIVAMHDVVRGDLVVARCVNPTCNGLAHIVTPARAGDVGVSPALVVVDGGAVVIAHGDASHRELVVLECEAAGCAHEPTHPAIGYIDAVVTEPGSVSVSGWAGDVDSPVDLGAHVYVDGTYATGVLATGERPDVRAAIPEVGDTVGFSVEIALEDGPHEVCVFAIDAVDLPTALGCPQIVVSGHLPLGYLDSAGEVDGGVRVTGWAGDADRGGPTPVELYVDGQLTTVVDADVPRGDVHAVFPQLGARTGFDVVLDVTESGSYEVCAHAVNDAGPHVEIGCRVVHIARPPFGYVDVVEGQAGEIWVTGWAVDPDTEHVAVYILVDGVHRGATSTRVERLDVEALFGRTNAGFARRVREIPPGLHEVCVELSDEVFGPTQLGCRAITVGDGHMPVGFLEGARSVDGGRVVTGWTVDPDSLDVPVRIEVEIDGVVVGTGDATLQRGDVTARIPGAGLSGYEIHIDAVDGLLCVFALDDATDARALLPTDSAENYLPCP